MHGSRIRRRTAGRPGLLVLLAVVTLAVLLMATLGACGDSGDGGEGGGSDEASVTGSYAFDSGTEEGMEGFTLTLNDDMTFMLTQTDPESGEEIGIGGTYTVEGDAISLTNDEGSESEAGTVEGDKLVFETITWVKK